MAVMNTPDGRQPRGRRHERKSQSGSIPQNQLAQEPQRYEPERKKLDLERWIIPVSAVMTGILTALAAPELLDTDSTIGWFKVVLLGGASMFVSGVVNHYAIKSGADLAAKGFRIAAFASLIPVLIVGSSAAVFGYSGLSIGQVNELAQQEHGSDLRTYVGDVNGFVTQSIALKPAIEATASDINRNLACEDTEACLSGGKAGKGAVYRAVLPLANRASDIAAQLETANDVRQDHLARADQLLTQYSATLSNREKSADEREQALMRTSGEVKSEAEALRQSLSTSLFAAYAHELKEGVNIGGKPEATQRTNAMLARNSASIRASLEGLKSDKSEAPAFPKKAGVSQAMERLDQFWPIAMLTFSIELTIPVVLWLWAYLSIVWQIYRDDHTPPSSPASNVKAFDRGDSNAA